MFSGALCQLQSIHQPYTLINFNFFYFPLDIFTFKCGWCWAFEVQHQSPGSILDRFLSPVAWFVIWIVFVNWWADFHSLHTLLPENWLIGNLKYFPLCCWKTPPESTSPALLFFFCPFHPPSKWKFCCWKLADSVGADAGGRWHWETGWIPTPSIPGLAHKGQTSRELASDSWLSVWRAKSSNYAPVTPTPSSTVFFLGIVTFEVGGRWPRALLHEIFLL